MKLFISAVALFWSATSAMAAEGWTCTYVAPIDNKPTVVSYQLSPPYLIDEKFHDQYRILQNNDYGIVAALSISEIEQGHTKPTVGAITVVINKKTGEFWLATTIAGQAAVVNQPLHGECTNH
jgi:hypothetical protein